jgi:copper homeostasis protein
LDERLTNHQQGLRYLEPSNSTTDITATKKIYKGFPKMPLEIACFSIASALVAANAGADRIELCANASVGGTTPPLSEFQTLKTALKTGSGVPVNVMIRPRGGDFVYSDDEFTSMEKEILEFGRLGDGGPDGFVFGVLEGQGAVDVARCRRLVLLAAGRQCTFHRAFDEVPVSGRGKALEDIIGLGFGAILTSGGASDAVGGKAVLEGLVRMVEGRGCEIIVGGGVRAGNIGELKEVVKARWYHSSADIRGGGADEEEVRKMVEMTERGL